MGILEKRRHRIFMQRTASMYRSANERQRMAGTVPLSKSLGMFREWVAAWIGKTCRYCNEEITVRNFSLDHDVPLSRGGSGEFANLSICCSGSNKAKGNMTADEFTALTADLGVLSHKFDNPNIKRHVLMSLKIASSFRFGSDRRAKKAKGAA